MVTGKISASRLRNLKPGKLGDGGGLWLLVKEGGSASWVFRYTLNGGEHSMGLGAFPDIDAAQARERAKRCRLSLKDGQNPMHERAKERTKASITFREAAEKFIEAKRPGWKNAKHAAQWESTLKEYAYPVLGSLPVDAIDEEHVLRVLTPIWVLKHETATRVRQRIEAVLNWSTVLHYRTGQNPAQWRGHLEKIMAEKDRSKKVKNHPALPYREMPDFWVMLAKQPGIGALALRFAILCASRTGEIIGALKSEITDGVWEIPGERMKAGKSHRIPLSSQAVEILAKLPESESPYLFPGSRRDQPLSNASMSAVLKRMERLDITVHGFRAAFKTWAEEQSTAPRGVIEASLAHTLKDKVEAAYFRGDLSEKRALLMQSWANYCTVPQVKGDVIPIRKAVLK